MITNTKATRILIYGDSFTYGKIPLKNDRWPIDIRFTGKLQNILGTDFEIIEEGLRGRTLFGENGYFPERDGLEQFGPILASHLPCKLVILFLGTNNVNRKASWRRKDITDALSSYIDKIKQWSDFLGTKAPELLVVLPPNTNESETYADGSKSIFGSKANDRVGEFRKILLEEAKIRGIVYENTSLYLQPGEDGIHLDETNNALFAEKLAIKLRSIING